MNYTQIIKIIEVDDQKELYLFDKFIASWDLRVDTMEVIIPYAIKEAVKIGEKKKQIEIKKIILGM